MIFLPKFQNLSESQKIDLMFLGSLNSSLGGHIQALQSGFANDGWRFVGRFDDSFVWSSTRSEFPTYPASYSTLKGLLAIHSFILKRERYSLRFAQNTCLFKEVKSSATHSKVRKRRQTLPGCNPSLNTVPIARAPAGVVKRSSAPEKT